MFRTLSVIFLMPSSVLVPVLFNMPSSGVPEAVFCQLRMDGDSFGLSLSKPPLTLKTRSPEHAMLVSLGSLLK